ncbi:hypothetical protein [Pseudomonas guariconensis]|uniref:hypothetical protein n=1 Tax=Pseudomonas guariconensis TaxID=1288410 RepID=UPI002B05C319|nr:hypothetical protein [Pseudomonas guariconensis]
MQRVLRDARMDLAKTSLTSVIDNLDDGVAMRLVTFEGCGHCAASNTGGRVYTANDAAAVAEALKQASQEVSAGGCS